MMTLKIQITIGIVLFIAFAAIVNMIRRKNLELKYALSWLAVIGVLFVIDCFPVLMVKLSMMLGIWSPVNMIFFLGFCFSLVIIFTLTVALSRVSARVRKLAQAAALNEKNIEMLKKKGNSENEKNNCDGK